MRAREHQPAAVADLAQLDARALAERLGFGVPGLHHDQVPQLDAAAYDAHAHPRGPAGVVEGVHGDGEPALAVGVRRRVDPARLPADGPGGEIDRDDTVPGASVGVVHAQRRPPRDRAVGAVHVRQRGHRAVQQHAVAGGEPGLCAQDRGGLPQLGPAGGRADAAGPDLELVRPVEATAYPDGAVARRVEDGGLEGCVGVGLAAEDVGLGDAQAVAG